jgi:predicted nucleotidyltransferase
MRLNNLEQSSIKKAFKDIFKNGEIYLFGSRVDDNKKGGDIDLYIIPQTEENLREKKSLFLSKLYEYIGEQKIDIVIAKNKSRLIEQEAIKNGVRL